MAVPFTHGSASQRVCYHHRDDLWSAAENRVIEKSVLQLEPEWGGVAGGGGDLHGEVFAP